MSGLRRAPRRSKSYWRRERTLPGAHLAAMFGVFALVLLLNGFNHGGGGCPNGGGIEGALLLMGGIAGCGVLGILSLLGGQITQTYQAGRRLREPRAALGTGSPDEPKTRARESNA